MSYLEGKTTLEEAVMILRGETLLQPTIDHLESLAIHAHETLSSCIASQLGLAHCKRCLLPWAARKLKQGLCPECLVEGNQDE